MNTKKINRWIFFTSLVIFVISLVGLVLLNFTYLKVDIKYLGEIVNQKTYSGYKLIFDQGVINASFEPLMHLIGYVFFLVGSLIFLCIEINNKYSKKKVNLEIKPGTSKKALTAIQIICSLVLVVIAVLVIIYGFLVSPSEQASRIYHIGSAKTINAILSGLNCLGLTLSINTILNLAKK